MSRRTLAALAVGWLLGIVTVLVTPTLVYQRQTLWLEGSPTLRDVIRDGWYIVRTDGVSKNLITIERPRFRLP